jgi:hypothetical protein
MIDPSLPDAIDDEVLLNHASRGCVMTDANAEAPADVAGLAKELNETHVYNRFGNLVRHPTLKKAAAALAAQAAEIERLTRARDDARALLAHTREWNTDWLLKNKERTAAAEARVAELTEVLEGIERIADSWDGGLAAQRNAMLAAARAALAKGDAR